MRRLLLCAAIAGLCATSMPADARHRYHHHGFGFARMLDGNDDAGPQGWKVYVNRDAGVAVDYPANVFSVKDGAPKEGTGARFRTADSRAELTVYSLPNASRDTPKTYLERHLMLDRSKLEYRRVSDRFFAISAIRNNKTFYSRCNFPGAGAPMQCIYLEYPAAETRAWDGIVTRISRSVHAVDNEAARNGEPAQQ